MVLLASSFDKGKYLKAADLDKERKFRIKSATDEVVGMGDDKEHRLVLWFTNDERGLILNRTNIRVLRETFGDVVDSWVGKIIVVYPTSVDFRGKLVPALRVRIPPPKQVAAAAPAPTPSPAGNGAAAPAPKTSAAPTDPELADEPRKPLREELDDEIPF
jgi:hypothetical protein